MATMAPPYCCRSAFVALLVICAGAVPVNAQAQTARISGTVVDSGGQVLSGVTVTLEAVAINVSAGDTPVSRVVTPTVSNGVGEFEFVALFAGTYVVTAERSGFSRSVHGPVQLSDGQSVAVRLPLALAPLSEIVNVVASTGAGAPIEGEEFRDQFLQIFQLPTDRFQEALPLLPGVIRDPRGRLSFNGTRPSQSLLLVNGINATDPVTGQFAAELPLGVIDTVEVQAIPYSAEFGQVSGAVADVRTTGGDDHWDVEVGGLFPNPRIRHGTLMGINTATPRVKVSGPLRRGQAWFSQGASYRFARSQVKEEIAGEDEEIVEGFDTFTQIDVKVSDRHFITGTFSSFLSNVDNLGINSLQPEFATPDSETNGWNVAIGDELVTGSNTLWQTQFALRGFDLAVRPKGAGPTRLTPDGLRGNYFNEIDRESLQLELSTARLQSWR